MADVIFAGSQERKPVGYAEVVLVLTSEDGEPFPGEFAQLSEVSVSRKLHRDGQSEYRINQRRVRRRDVVDLFLDTGVGNNLYSFIEQGRIGKIVHAHADERRALIDEAAGISRYKVRRDEAQQRLVATAAQLDRASDVADEMARRVRALGRQVKKSALFRRHRAIVKQRETALAMAKYGGLAGDRRALRAKVRTAEGTLDNARRARVRREEDLRLRREELAVVEAGAEQWRDEVAELDATTRELSGKVSFEERRVGELTERRAAADARAVALEDAKAEFGRVISEIDRQISEGRERELELSSHMKSAQEELDRSAAIAAEAAENLEHQQRRFAEAGAAVQVAQGEMARVDEALGRAPAAIQGLDQELQASIQAVSDATSALDHAKELAAQVAEQVTGATSAREEAATLLATRGDESAQAEDAVEALRAGFERAQADLERVMQEAEQSVQDKRSALERLRDSARAQVENASTAFDAEADQARVRLREQQASTRREEASRAEEEVRSLQVGRRQKEQGLREKFAAELAAVIVQIEQDEARIREEAEAEFREATARIESEMNAKQAALEDQLQQALDVGSESEQILENARTEVRIAQTEIAKAELRLAAIQGALEAADNQSEDLVIVRRAIPEATQLVEAIPPDLRSHAELGRWMGNRLMLPVLRKPEHVQRVLDGLEEGESVRFIVRAGPLQTVSDILGNLPIVEGVHQLTAGTAAVTQDGIRVSEDGVYEVGGSANAAQQTADLINERDTLEESLRRHRAQVTAAERAVQDAETANESAEEGLEACRAALKALGEQRQDAIRGLRIRVDRNQDERRDALRSRRDIVERESISGQADALALLEETVEQEVARSRTEGAARLAALEDRFLRETAELEADLTTRRAEAVERARVEISASIASATVDRDQAIEALAQARERMTDLRVNSLPEIEQAKSKANGARIVLESARVAMLEAEGALSKASLEQSRKVAEVNASDLSLRHAVAARDDLAARLSAAEDSATQLTARRLAVAGDLEAKKADLRKVEAELKSAQEAARSSQAVREAMATQHAKAEVEVATLQEQLRGAQSRKQELSGRLEENAQERTSNQATILHLTDERERSFQIVTEAKEQLAKLDVQMAEASARLERERARLTVLRAEANEGEEQLRKLATKELETSQEVEKLRESLDSVKEQVDHIKTTIAERYQLSIPGLWDQLDARGDLVLDPPPAAMADVLVDDVTVEGVKALVLTRSDLSNEDEIAAWVAELGESKEQLARLGEVNLTAVDEWQQTKERHADLEEQRADLEASVQQIRAAMAKMNRTCRQRFRDTFDLVNAHFQEMYPRLVGGGAASLSLTNEDDLLETGVEIFVQPPGKRLQRLTLLSGGEKAMTAIALILSLFKVKPSPFCVLDEVDAPLDEANGSRFNEALVEMSDRSQFILITHNRKTMECASALYGVTMPKPGCSSLVSVKIGES